MVKVQFDNYVTSQFAFVKKHPEKFSESQLKDITQLENALTQYMSEVDDVGMKVYFADFNQNRDAYIRRTSYLRESFPEYADISEISIDNKCVNSQGNIKCVNSQGNIKCVNRQSLNKTIQRDNGFDGQSLNKAIQEYKKRVDLPCKVFIYEMEHNFREERHMDVWSQMTLHGSLLLSARSMDIDV